MFVEVDLLGYQDFTISIMEGFVTGYDAVTYSVIPYVPESGSYTAVIDGVESPVYQYIA